jgi:hypothetical protein
MGWFRSKRGGVAWLAFFALACQFILTFGHVHLNNVGAISAAMAIAADATNGSAGAPTQKPPTGLAQDFCAVCSNITLASTLVLPLSPAIILSISSIRAPQWQLVATEFASRDHFVFDARGPPLA